MHPSLPDAIQHMFGPFFFLLRWKAEWLGYFDQHGCDNISTEIKVKVKVKKYVCAMVMECDLEWN